MAGIVFIVNPSSGNATTGRTWARAERELRRQLGSFEVATTAHPGDATRLARRALAEGADVVVAVGGDGTIGEVVNGFFTDGVPMRRDAALAILPRGTGGDLRRTFGWSTSPRAAAGRITGGRTRRLDVGRVRFVGHDGSPAERLFLNVASFGISGNVDRAVEHASKRWGGRLSFALGSLKALRSWRDVRCRVRLDDGPEEELSLTCLAAANGRFFGGGMQVAPGAVPDDGVLELVIWQGYGLADFLFRARRLYDGSHVAMEGTRLHGVGRVEASCDEPCLVDIDGETPGCLPVTIDLLPAALPVLV